MGVLFSKSDDFDDGNFVEVEANNDSELPGYSKPSFEKAAEHYRSTLSHRLKDSKQATGYKLARLGEMKRGDAYAEDYSFLFTPAEAFDEFGIGISLYFKTLKTLGVVILICALISLVAIEKNRASNPTSSVDGCSDDDCIQETPTFLLGSVYGAEREDLKVAYQGASDIAVCCILFIFSIVAAVVEEKSVVAADAGQQTTSDYTCVIRNPPSDVTDPTAYYDHFKKFGDIVFVTVCLRNGELLQALSHKKVLEAELTGLRGTEAYRKQKNKPFLKQEDLTATQLFLQKTLGMYRTSAYLEQEYEKITRVITGLTQKDFVPWRVFITFNAERGLRSCLDGTQVSKWEMWQNTAENRNAVFGGKTLFITATGEPSEIIWENSHVLFPMRIVSWITSYCLAFSIIVMAFYVVQSLKNTGNVAVALFISLLNAMLPYFMKTLTIAIEIHVERSELERSMLLKLVVVRCINSGVLIYLASDYEQTFRLAHLESVQNILLFDAFFTPFYRVFDLDGLFYRYVLAWGAKTQAEMNSVWQGTEWTLAERYTDMLKTVFVGIFFAIPLPSGLFITAIAMFNVYLVDRYLLMKVWRRPPQLDGTLSVVARYFFVISVFAHASISRVYFANWPYRGIYNTDDDAPKETCGFILSCEQSDVMTEDQKSLISIYNVGATISFFMIIAALLYRHVGAMLLKVFIGFELSGEADETDILFGDVDGIDAFVPVVTHPNLTDPILCADVSDIPDEYLPIPRGYFDVQEDPQAFSIVKHEEFPSINSQDDAALKAMFSRILYVEPPAPVEKNFGFNSSSNMQSSVAPITTDYTKSLLAAAAGATAGSTLSSDMNRLNADVKHTVVSPASATLPLSSVNNTNTDVTNRNSISDGSSDLPPFWEIKHTKQGKVYYVDHNTKTTHWKLPSTATKNNISKYGPGVATAAPGSANANKNQATIASLYGAGSGTSSAAVVLPTGWERKATAQGKVYYVDHNTCTTHWNLPRTAAGSHS